MRRTLPHLATTLLIALAAGLALAASGNAAAATPATSWHGASAAGCATTLESTLTAIDRAFDGAATPAQVAASTTQARCLVASSAAAPAATRALAARVAADVPRMVAATGARRAALRGATSTRLRVLARHATVAATRAGDIEGARAWLTLRERRPATRLGVPDAPAAAAIVALASGDTTAAEAAAIVTDDLDQTALIVLRSRLDAVEQRVEDELHEGAVVDAARAAAGMSQFSGAPAPATRAAAQLERSATAASVDDDALAAAARALATGTEGFVAGPGLTEQAAADTAGKLARFIELVPIEYGRGVRGGEVSLDLEIQEARSFLRGALDAWTALEPSVTSNDAAAIAAVGTRLEAMDALVTRAETTPNDVADADAMTEAADDAVDALGGVVPAAWLEADAAADLELTRSALRAVDGAAGRSQWQLAEQSRVEAYGAFEFGPELRLRAIDPALALHVEELIWFGDGTVPGLATLIADRAAPEQFQPTLAELDTQLDRVEERLGTAATPGAIRTNSAIIVLREGMEAVLILAALTAGLSGAGSARWRRPILIGGLLAIIATGITFVLAHALLGSLARFGERLEVVVSLVAIGVLLLILNWFVHKAYWTGWMANFQKRKVAIAGTARERREAEQAASTDRSVAAVAQVGGLIVLGFTSIYREGFETVLFLQALVLDAGTLPVLEGAAIGLAAVTGLAVLTIRLQRRLPYRRMLIVTGVLIAVVLAAMVGGTVQAMQAVGWMSVHPIGGLHVPAWASTWLGVHPTWEAVGGQFAALVFVLGSYVVAEWWSERRRLRARADRGSHVAAQLAPNTNGAAPA